MNASQTEDDLQVPEYLGGLNARQRAAVLAGTGPHAPADAPLLVIAGAGTGKTNTLAHRVAHLVACGADPGRLLLLTFSTRAADEMTRRAARILARLPGGARVNLPWAGTFHSVGARLLREYAGRIGLDAAFTIHDREDSADLMNLVRHERGASAKEKRFPLKGTCLAIYSTVVNTGAALGTVLQQRFAWCAEWEDELKALFLDYVTAKQAQQVLDYDDLLLYWARMVEDPDLAGEIGGRFAHVLVDEYQDTNRLQASLLRAMKPDGRGVTVVGDDAQAIYAFRGATVRNILEFPGHFDPPAQRVTLERNYRSTAPILAAANAVIALAPERYAKELTTERTQGERPRLVAVRDDADQAGYVVEQVLARRERGIALRSQAVLFRAAHHSARLELELTRRNIPFIKFGGLKFLEAAHVKDLLAVLRYAQNPRDRICGFRAWQLLPGVGPKTAARLLEQRAGAAAPAAPAAAGATEQACAAFRALLDGLAGEAAAWPASFERAARWVEAQLAQRYDDAALRAADLQQLARIAATYPSMERFLTELTLDPPDATSDEAGAPLLDEDYLILSTIHSAKGREWQAVSLLNVVDGCLPSDLSTGSRDEIEEERRLLYVAMTRAREHLELVVPQRFHVHGQSGLGDRHVYAGRSRFLPQDLLGQFELVRWPERPADAAPPAEGLQRAPIDLAARMREMWR